MVVARVETLIKEMGMLPHPEGGFFKETFRSDSLLQSPINGEPRNSLTDIYFLLAAGQISRFHKVLHDEVWHFYEGTPLTLIEMDPDSLEVSKVMLGNTADTLRYKHCIKGGRWQAALSTGDYSLAGCTVAPGFDFADFQFLKDDVSTCSRFIKEHPELTDLL